MEELLRREQDCLQSAKQRHFSAPTETPYSPRRQKSYSNEPSTSEASSAVPPPSPTPPSPACLPQEETNVDPDRPPSLHETIRAVQQLSSGKAPGSDVVPTEI
ncbi:hypothetical protein SprV_0200829500 [Sparganum proliferum]